MPSRESSRNAIDFDSVALHDLLRADSNLFDDDPQLKIHVWYPSCNLAERVPQEGAIHKDLIRSLC